MHLDFWRDPAATNESFATGEHIALRAEFEPPVAAREIIEKWKTFQVTIEYDGGVSRTDVTEAMVRALYSNFNPRGLFG